MLLSFVWGSFGAAFFFPACLLSECVIVRLIPGIVISFLLTLFPSTSLRTPAVFLFGVLLPIKAAFLLLAGRLAVLVHFGRMAVV